MLLRNMNIGDRTDDNRRNDVLAQDLPCFGGSQLAVDVTLRSALGCTVEPQPHTADVDGPMLVQARVGKETTCPELVESGWCRMVVVAIETGGCWSDEAADLLRTLTFASCVEVARRVGVGTLVDPSELCDTWCHTGGEAPTLSALLVVG